jgi:prepilin-type N-terminal cleavage/methylation domain-containing protein
VRKVSGHGRLGCTPERPACTGFTLIEVMWTMVVFSVLAGIAVSGLRSWTKAHEHSGTAAGIQSVLREAQQRAVTEGRSMCVDFDVAAQTYAMYRSTCVDPARLLLQGPLKTAAADVRLANPVFAGKSNATPSVAIVSTGVTFYPRGTAWPGSVQLTRTGSSKVWTVSVEGLTGRVSRA